MVFCHSGSFGRMRTVYIYLVLLFAAVDGQHVCTSNQADLVFLLDSSGSVGKDNFITELSFVSDFVQGFSVGPAAVQFSVVTYSSSATTRFDLGVNKNQADLQKAIESITYESGSTNTAGALTYVRDNSFLPSRGGRSEVTKILIVITDGKDGDTASVTREATLLHDLGVKVFSVGVGSGIDMDELQAIASQSDFVFSIADFQALTAARAEIQRTTCTELNEEKCGLEALSVTSRILNAPASLKCEWPWMVAVRLGTGNVPTQMCAGVLIGRRKVITTASCVVGKNVASVVVGENNILLQDEVLTSTVSEATIQVARTVLHPRFRGKENDIAVVQLVEDVVYNACVLPACLPPFRQDTCQKEEINRCVFAGWGLYTDTSFALSDRLRVAAGRYLSPNVCAIIYRLGRNNFIPAHTGCIVPHNKDRRPCQGDEGGMVSCFVQGKWVLQSLINIPSCMDNFPALGVDLSHPDVLNFIKNN